MKRSNRIRTSYMAITHKIKTSYSISAVTIASVALIAIALVGDARAAGMAVDAGLWKITSQGQRAGTTIPPTDSTQCFTQKELDDPDSAFAQPPTVNGVTCKRTNFQQTATSISWQYQCTGAATVTTEGSISFDSRTHYTGSVKTTGNAMGQQLNDSIQMDGKRVGDCPATATPP